jgi:hypothetical protein
VTLRGCFRQKELRIAENSKYGATMSHYGASKVAAESLIAQINSQCKLTIRCWEAKIKKIQNASEHVPEKQLLKIYLKISGNVMEPVQMWFTNRAWFPWLRIVPCIQNTQTTLYDILILGELLKNLLNQVYQFYLVILQISVTFLGEILKNQNVLADLSFGLNYSLKQ